MAIFLFPDLTINAQPVENRSQKSARRGARLGAHRGAHLGLARRSTEANPQSTGCLPADALLQRQSSRPSGKSTKTQRTQIIDRKTFFYSEQQYTLCM